MLTDIEIAQAAQTKPITDIANACGIDGKYLELYGNRRRKWTTTCCVRKTTSRASWCW